MRKRFDNMLTGWDSIGVRDRGYSKYVELGARNADYTAIDSTLIKDMGPLAGESTKTKSKDKKKDKKKKKGE